MGLIESVRGVMWARKRQPDDVAYGVALGHERFTPVKVLLAKHPERVIEKAVWGMLPKTTLSRQKVKQMLKVYAGPTHPHAAQQPQPLALPVTA